MSDPTQDARQEALRAVLDAAYEQANGIVEGKRPDDLPAILGEPLAQQVDELASIKNAGRGVALTLTAYKLVEPGQDVRAHKAEHPGGFTARTVDSKVVVPFLIEHSLPRNVETHWLSQTYSFAGPLMPGTVLRTQPRKAGVLVAPVVNAAQERGADVARAILATILKRLIIIRNNDRVVLTRPKDLPIAKVRRLIELHLSGPYKANAPRLPQLVIYAAYQRLVGASARYEGAVLEPLERLKSADRKSGTIGDVVVARGGARMEAVEIKHDQPISYIHVAEAIDKVRAQSVRRYYLLSNRGIDPGDVDRIAKETENFRLRNGCEIIINGVLDSLAYYLRILPDTTGFLADYAMLVENDEDTGYEHRIRWNECCDSI